VLVVAVCVGLLATGSNPALADSDGAVAIRIVVTGRLAGQSATLRVHDRASVHTVRAGQVTIVPSPIVVGTPSTARIRRFAAERGDVVRVHYRKDETSRPGVLTPVARGADGEPATAGNLVPSPDRTRLAFISRDPDLLGPDESGGLFVRELSTGVVTKLARDAAGGIEWSPDSRRIAFRTDAATPAIHVKDLETGDVTVATPRSVPVAWADSDHLVMSVCRTARHCGIGVQDLATGRIRRVVPVAHRVGRWTLAPDGRSLLFESREDPLHRGIDRRSLYLADVETAKMAVLHTTAGGRPVKGASWAAVWSPDSYRVAFRSARGRFSRIMVKNLISGAVTRLSTASDNLSHRADRPVGAHLEGGGIPQRGGHGIRQATCYRDATTTAFENGPTSGLTGGDRLYLRAFGEADRLPPRLTQGMLDRRGSLRRSQLPQCSGQGVRQQSAGEYFDIRHGSRLARDSARWWIVVPGLAQ
jgi:hypothetical protein